MTVRVEVGHPHWWITAACGTCEWADKGSYGLDRRRVRSAAARHCEQTGHLVQTDTERRLTAAYRKDP